MDEDGKRYTPEPEDLTEELARHEHAQATERKRQQTFDDLITKYTARGAQAPSHPPPEHATPDDHESVAANKAATPTPVEPYRPTNRASLPGLHRSGSHGPELPSFVPDDAPEQLQFDLPGFEPTVTGCPSWLLWLYDRAGGAQIPQTGRVAPAPMRLFIGALLHLGIDDRDGEWHTVHLATDEVIFWLHPGGWANRRRDWDRFPAALHAMRQLTYLPVDGIGYVALLFPSIIPRKPTDPMVQFTIRVPPSAARGARIDWPRLCRYGIESATVYRAYLAVSAYLDRTAHRGHPITAEIAAPLTGPRGPRLRKDGRIARSPIDRIKNKATRYVTPLTEAGLTTMLGFNPDDRDHRRKARIAFEKLHEDGAIDLHREGREWWLFGPRTAPRPDPTE